MLLFFWQQIKKGDTMNSRIAIIGIIIEDSNCIKQVNDLLHQFSEYIIGRMGLPYPNRNINIINIIMDAPEDITSSLAGRLGMIDKVSAKAMYSKNQKV